MSTFVAVNVKVMKNFYYLIASMAICCCVGCATDLSEDAVVTTPQDFVLTVDVAASQTKVSLGDRDDNGGYKVYWDEGDRISANGYISEVATIGESNAGSAEFEFKNAILNYPYNILYPATESNRVVFAEEQNYREGSFEVGVAPMYAHVERSGEGIQMRHLSGVLRFSIKGGNEAATLKNMVVTSGEGKIAGEFMVDFERGTITSAESAVSTINYSFGEGLTLSADATKEFFVVLPCGEFGLCSAELITTDGRKMNLLFRTSEASAIKAGVVREFGAVTFRDGVTCTLQPFGAEEDELDVDTSLYTKKPTTTDGDFLVIKDAGELIWLCHNEPKIDGTLYNKIRLGANIDMSLLSNLLLPSMRLAEGAEIDGKGNTLTGVNMNKSASSLFGDVDNLNIHDLTLSDCSVNTTLETGAGILVGSANKGLTVSNVVLNNCRVKAPCKIGLVAGALHTGTFALSGVTANGGVVETSFVSGKSGLAGGLVGCIAKNGDGATTSTATFTNCTTSATVKSYMESASYFYGKMVGQLGGYNGDEKLYFVNCSGEGATLVPLYDQGAKNAESARLSFAEAYRADFCETLLSTATDCLLGGECYCRGEVYFDGKRFVSEWDGVRAVVMLKDDDGRNLVYSPYDLAKAQGVSYGDTTGVVFMTSVDMGGHRFKPINYVRYLDGGGFELHNLKVVRTHDAANNRGAGFIIYASGTTIHKNLTFVGADVTCNHDATVAVPAYGDDKDGGAGNAYAGTLVSRSWRSAITDADGNTTGYTTYTISNIHARNGKVRGVCKVGGLVGAMRGEITMDNCSVDGYQIENYEPNIVNYYKMTKVVSSYTIEGLQWWYTNGECGGLIGFLEAHSATISNCSVTNTNLNCTGQPNKDVVANIWDTSAWKEGAYTSGVNIRGNATTTIAGRHINQFIGDVRSRRSETQANNGTGEYTMTISDYTVSGNTYNGVAAESTNDFNHNYASGSYCEVAGCVYYVGVDIGSIAHVNECAGTFTFNAKGASAVTLTEAIGKGDNMNWFGGNCKDLKYTMIFKSGTSYYPPAPAN